jgi:hypothetical protein
MSGALGGCVAVVAEASKVCRAGSKPRIRLGGRRRTWLGTAARWARARRGRPGSRRIHRPPRAHVPVLDPHQPQLEWTASSTSIRPKPHSPQGSLPPGDIDPSAGPTLRTAGRSGGARAGSPSSCADQDRQVRLEHRRDLGGCCATLPTRGRPPMESARGPALPSARRVTRASARSA